MIDVGIGFGVLSIVSVKLGVKFILVIDFDEIVICVVEENIILNKIEYIIIVK